MTKATTKTITADDICEAHGCEIHPGANRAPVLVVQPRYQGSDNNTATLARCKQALRDAGHEALANRLLS